MLSYQIDNKNSFNEALPVKPARADFSTAVSTNPKAISRLISAAIVDRAFQKLLLSRPELALANGYNGEIFDLTDEDRALILTIQATSINDFAAQLIRLRENNCSGDWVIQKKHREADAYPVALTTTPSWKMASLPTS
jgi:hypothetical protein